MKYDLSPHFTLAELTKSSTAIRMGIHNEPEPNHFSALTILCKTILEPVREHFGVAFSPSSGFRSPQLCEAIGSSKKSQHTKGEAADFEVPGVDNHLVASWIRDNLDFDQLILEGYTDDDKNSGWIHCSTKSDWNRKEVLRYHRDTGYLKGLG
jgi:zinc D-Ala-D-Ala carboxypeptidase